MTDDAFKALCNTYGFAPSRALRELIDCVRAQERESCAKVCDVIDDGREDLSADCAAAIRARSKQ